MNVFEADLVGTILRHSAPLPNASCRDRSELFDELDPTADPDNEHDRLEAAVTVCHTCPALDPCRAWFFSLRPSQRPVGVVAGQINTKQPKRSTAA